MFRIDIRSLKGGTGKSLVAYHLAKELSKTNKVALIDRSYSKTISNYFKIADEFPNGKYFRDESNLRVSAISCSNNYLKTNDKIVMEEYGTYENYDYVIVDDPSYSSDQCLEKDLVLWTLTYGDFTYSTICVLTPPEELIEYSLGLLPTINAFITSMVNKYIDKDKNSFSFNPFALVINQVRSSQKIDFDKIKKALEGGPVISIPFRKELYNSIFEYEVEEIKTLVDYIKSLGK